MNRAEIMRQSVAEKQGQAIEKLDRFSRLSVQWERDLGEVLLTMREFQEAIQADSKEQKKLVNDWTISQKRSLEDLVKKQEDATSHLAQKYGDIERTTRNGVLGWKIAVCAVFLLGLGIGWWVNAKWNQDEDRFLANYLRIVEPELAGKVLAHPEAAEALMKQVKE